MTYPNIEKGIFLSRPNRFIAYVDINGKTETVHVKNTGRCKELLIEGCTVYLNRSDNPERKTKYDLIAVEKKKDDNSFLLINMDSQIVNDVAFEWLTSGKPDFLSDKAFVRREVKYGNSRFDFFIEDGNRKIFIEAKGVTLEKDGAVLFPDAPTERGVKHLNELSSCIEKGYEAMVLFIIQMQGVNYFSPNTEMHKEFSDALKNARKKGVKILAYDAKVTPSSITLNKPVKIKL